MIEYFLFYLVIITFVLLSLINSYLFHKKWKRCPKRYNFVNKLFYIKTIIILLYTFYLLFLRTNNSEIICFFILFICSWGLFSDIIINLFLDKKPIYKINILKNVIYNTNIIN